MEFHQFVYLSFFPKPPQSAMRIEPPTIWWAIAQHDIYEMDLYLYFEVRLNTLMEVKHSNNLQDLMNIDHQKFVYYHQS